MKKPIIATSLKGLFIKNSPWIDAHILWYEEREKEIKKNKLDNSAIKEWRQLFNSNPERERKEYFKYVDKIMKVLYPNLSDMKRTEKARELFFDATIKYIKQNSQVINQPVVDYFLSLKKSYRLALITTNTPQALKNILKASNLEKMFDIIEAEEPTQKDKKDIVFNIFIKNYGKPSLYIGTGEEGIIYCQKNNIPCIYADLENQKEIEGVNSVHNLKELKEKIITL